MPFNLLAFAHKMPNPFKLVQRSGFIRPKNPVASDQEILCHPGRARRLLKNINAGKYFVKKNNFPGIIYTKQNYLTPNLQQAKNPVAFGKGL